MTVFYENDPSLQSYWRSIVLYGKNVASYKFALAKSLIDLKKQPNDFVKLEDLAAPFSKHLCEHLKHNDKQATSPSSSFLNTCRKFNSNETSLDELIQTTKKLGFNNVIDAFHIVNGGEIPKRFFIDERRENDGIRITENFFKLNELQESENLPREVEARWRLVETAWDLNMPTNLIKVKYDNEREIFYADKSNRRIDVTPSKDALNGYQKGKCFFCFDYISVLSNSPNLCHVDHFFPHTLKGKPFDGYVDGVWNLVLACQSCNNGANGKFAKLPTNNLLARLNKRNEFFCSSHHPLNETVRNQVGVSPYDRESKLKHYFKQAQDILIHTWEPQEIRGEEVF
ncbi:HNH endonuclease [Alphaproteobacteria bacterium]|nr:HNH endonuclease [Alphaproteobacteria bacterium]